MHSTSRFRFALLRCARLLSDEVNALLLQHGLNYSLWQSLVIIKLNGQCTALDIKLGTCPRNIALQDGNSHIL